MIKHARKIESKKKRKKIILHRINEKVGDWEFSGFMTTGEPVWYNKIDDYILMMHVN